MNTLTFELIELCNDILEFAEHGDYSNGNEAYGVDEGRVRAGECLDLYRKRFDALKDLDKVKITYRGWPGHYCMGSKCVFHLNTLVEVGDVRVVVSTVGNLRSGLPHMYGAEEVGCGRYYETMAFRAALIDGYWDQESGQSISLSGKTAVTRMTKQCDQEAQDMHEVAVRAITNRILSGELKWEDSHGTL